MNKITKILVSQPHPLTERNPYAEMEQKYGVHFDFRQLIHVEELTPREFRQQRINPLDYTAVLCNSRLAIDHYFHLCSELRLQVPDTMHYYCISEAVANYLQKYIQYRKRKVFYAEHNNFEELLPAMNRRPNEKYLIIMSDVHTNDIIERFAQKGINIQPAVMYRTVPNVWPEGEAFDHDMVVLFTPVGVHALHNNFPDLKSGDKVMACFGQNTASALEELGMKADIVAPSPECSSITQAIDQYLEQHFS